MMSIVIKAAYFIPLMESEAKPLRLLNMIEKNLPETHHSKESISRSVLKTISYRFVILILDFVAIYLFTGKVKIAIGFMIVSNIYTTVGYFIHERIWDKIKWGKKLRIIGKESS
jgi:adenylylsulfate kinase